MVSRIKAIAVSRPIFDYIEINKDVKEFLSADLCLLVLDRFDGIDLGTVYYAAQIAGLKPSDYDRDGTPSRWVRK